MPISAGAANLLADHRAHVIPGCAHGSRQVFFLATKLHQRVRS
jgi:hypothetical protein